MHDRVRIDSSFRFDVSSGHYETQNSWAELRIRKDSRRGDYYIEALFGTKGEKRYHTHVGINADQTLRFMKSRGVIHSIERKVDSKMEGHLETRSATLNDKPPRGKLTFKVIIDEPSRMIRFLLDEVKLEDMN